MTTLSLLLMLAGPTFANGFRTNPTVCSITLEGDVEKQTFEKHLGTINYNFVELTPQTEEDKENDKWFDKACESGVQCDILIISGHFGGTFFGKSTLSLPIEELEKNSCRKDCSGILSRPKEVFLFGCNTLAGKEPDSRTPEEYLRVLIEDGIDRAEAERVTESRYGDAESNAARMSRVFEGVKHIYGFNSIGPSGQHVQRYLDDYLVRTGDYRSHLNEASQNRNPNILLAQALKNTSFDQTSGISPDSQASEFKQQLCTFFDSQSLGHKMELARSLISGPDFLAYLPVLQSFFKDNPPPYQEAAVQSIVDQIRGDERARTRFQSFIGKVGMPVLKVNSVNLGRTIGWLSDDETRDIILPIMERLLKPPLNDTSRGILFSIASNNPGIGKTLANFQFDPRIFSEPDAFYVLGDLGVTTPQVVEMAEKALKNPDVERKRDAYYYFSHALPESTMIRQSMLQALLDTDFQAWYRALDYFRRLDFDDTPTKLALLNALHFMPQTSQQSMLVDMLGEQPRRYNIAPIRHELAQLMGNMGDSYVKGKVARLLQEYCLEQTSDCREPFIHEAWRSALNNQSDYNLRFAASLALLDLGDTNPKIYEIASELIHLWYKPDAEEFMRGYRKRADRDPKLAELLGIKPKHIGTPSNPPATVPQSLGSLNLPLGPATP